MKIKVQEGKLEKFVCDLLVLKWVKGQKMDGSTGSVDKLLGGLLKKMIQDEDFKGAEGECFVFSTLGKAKAKKIMVLGLGEQSNVTPELVRRSTARIVQEARKQRAKKIATIIIGTGTAAIDPYAAAKAMAEGALLGSYVFSKYKSKDAEKYGAFPAELTMVTAGVHERALGTFAEKMREALRGVRMGVEVAQATIIARDLVNEPAMHMHPKQFADAARLIVADTKRVTITVKGKKEIEALGMGAYLGVAQGSQHEPQLIHLVYKGAGTPKKKIALIGKGITFDSGGLSLKPSHAMETMKCDMAGAATVLGVFSALANMDIPIEVHGIAAVCENMPSSKAMRPGDVVRTMSGKTVEVLNTDAEGRLTLIDAITYAKEKIKPDIIIDLATLTGACISALGEEIAGYMGNNAELLAAVKKAGEQSGEMLWELPLPPEYKSMMKSHIADYTNVTPSKRGGGAITAGLFLQEFVGKTPWVHMDIAGPAFAESHTISYMPYGGTGFGVRTLIDFLEEYSK